MWTYKWLAFHSVVFTSFTLIIHNQSAEAAIIDRRQNVGCSQCNHQQDVERYNRKIQLPSSPHDGDANGQEMRDRTTDFSLSSTSGCQCQQKKVLGKHPHEDVNLKHFDLNNDSFESDSKDKVIFLRASQPKTPNNLQTSGSKYNDDGLGIFHLLSGIFLTAHSATKADLQRARLKQALGSA